MDLDAITAQQVLDKAIGVEDEKQLYSFHNDKVYVFQPHREGMYHGYPATKPRDVSSKALRELYNIGIIDFTLYKILVKKVEGK